MISPFALGSEIGLIEPSDPNTAVEVNPDDCGSKRAPKIEA